jgi:uncharacterized protein DUF6880
LIILTASRQCPHHTFSRISSRVLGDSEEHWSSAEKFVRSSAMRFDRMRPVERGSNRFSKRPMLVESKGPRSYPDPVTPAPEGSPFGPEVEQLARRGAHNLARFILTLANDDNGVGAYVRAFVAGDNVADARKLLEAELNTIREGEREYDYRHRRGDVKLRRVDHLLDAIELVVLPADPRAAFELLTRVIEADGQVAESAGDAWIQPTFDRACDLWFAAAKAVPAAEAEQILVRLTASDDYGLRDRLGKPAGDATAD